MAAQFTGYNPTLVDLWRSIILYGRNVASYKFALAKALLDLRPPSGRLVKLEDLAVPFSEHLAEHLKHAEKQATSRSSRFLDACRKYNAGELSREELTATTVKLGFNNVIDAFHVVERAKVPRRFFEDERAKGGIRVTDEFERLLTGAQASNLPSEVESRWRLVETAWQLGIGRNLIAVGHDVSTESLFATDRFNRRRSVTSSRSALNGYQRGRCFYCFSDLQLESGNVPDVDHFFPNILKQADDGPPLLDGIWNLVLACQDCNRGVGGKFARVPSLTLLKRLWKRNEYLIASHHPLRETLMQQTGSAVSQRRAFLNQADERALANLIHRWEPEPRGPVAF